MRVLRTANEVDSLPLHNIIGVPKTGGWFNLLIQFYSQYQIFMYTNKYKFILQ